MADYLALLRELSAFDPPLHVFGSVAEAALLEGRLGPAHGDLDVLIPRAELPLRLEQLGELGFASFEVFYEPRPGLPLVYGGSRGDVAVEVSLLDHDAAGDPYFAVEAGTGVVAVALPRDLFEWPPTVIDGVSIHTLSPLTLVQMRAGATATGAFGPARPDKDDARQARMIEAFFPTAAPEALEPRITAVA